MQKTTLALSIALLLSTNANAATELKTITQKASYALGSDLANNFIRQGVDIDSKALLAGLEDVMNKKKLQLTAKEMSEAVNNVKKAMVEKQLKARKVIGEKNATKGKDFLAKNKNKPNVKTLPSGIQYIVISTGKGNFATEDDYLSAHYRGTLIDGTEFDSSYSRSSPIEFQMGNVIKGWGEALKKMNPGSKWKIFVPSNLAYGEKGAGKSIGPNETLIFEIELLTISKTKNVH
jgi:FKBP-type peptidyl-prolyl cis-trans isomerase FklB